MMCNRDCKHCPYPDCISDEESQEEIEAAEARNKSLVEESLIVKNWDNSFYRYNHSDAGKARAERYEMSEKGKARAKRYEMSGKGKDRAKRYEKSEKGKATRKAYEQSDRRKALNKTRRDAHKGERKEYFRQYYLRRKESEV